LPLAAPAGALAQTPFAPLPSPSAPAAPAQTAPARTSTTGDKGGGLSTGTELLIFVAALALIAGIAFVIVRDARAAAAKRRGGGAPSKSERATTPPRGQRVQKSREKARAARRARKRAR
jgi:hypothetical protein